MSSLQVQQAALAREGPIGVVVADEEGRFHEWCGRNPRFSLWKNPCMGHYYWIDQVILIAANELERPKCSRQWRRRGGGGVRAPEIRGSQKFTRRDRYDQPEI